MTISYRYNATTDILIVTVVGDFGPQTFEEALRYIAESQVMEQDVATVWDLRRGNFSDISSAMVHDMSLAKTHVVERKRACIAAVVPNNLAFGVLRMFQTLSDVNNSHPENNFWVGFEISEAIDWIIETRSNG